MNKALKIFLWIIVVIIIVAAVGFFWGKSSWDKINFSKPAIQGLDLQGLTAADLVGIALTGQTKTVTVALGMAIQNENNFSVPFSNMKIKFFYGDTLIAETSDSFSQKNFTLPANGTLAVNDTVNIILNNAGGQLLIEKIKGNNVQLNYTIGISVFGIPIGWLIPKQNMTF